MILPRTPELDAYQASRTMKRLPAYLVERCNFGWSVPGVVWLSRDYLAQVYPPAPGTPIRITINKTQLVRIEQTPRGPYPIWKDGISWDELMRVKREIGFGDCDAVEIYPRDEDVIDVAAMRHLWIVPRDLIPFAWSKTPMAAKEPAQ